jgi:hypothetical protein
MASVFPKTETPNILNPRGVEELGDATLQQIPVSKTINHAGQLMIT